MHKAFNAGQKLHKSAKGREAHNLAGNNRAGFEPGGHILPGIALGLLARKRNAHVALAVLADGDNLGAHGVAKRHGFVRCAHARPGKFGKMDHAFNRRSKFHECAKSGKTRDLAFNHIAGLEAFKQGVELFGTFALNNGAVRDHNISAAIFNADNQKRHAAAHNLGGVFRRGNAKLAAGAECLLAKHVNRVAALAHCGYAAVNRHCRIAGFFKRGNAAAAHGAGKANLLRGNASNPRFEAVAGLNAFIALGIKNVFAVNDAVNLYAHVHKNAVASDGDYSSGHFLAGLQAV